MSRWIWVMSAWAACSSRLQASFRLLSPQLEVVYRLPSEVSHQLDVQQLYDVA